MSDINVKVTTAQPIQVKIQGSTLLGNPFDQSLNKDDLVNFEDVRTNTLSSNYARVGGIAEIYAPTNVAGSIVYGDGGDYFNAGYSHWIQVYEYKTVDAVKYYSQVGQSTEVQDDFEETQNYYINWSWTGSGNQDGFIVLKKDTINGYTYEVGVDVGNTTSYTDFGDYWDIDGTHTPTSYTASYIDGVNNLVKIYAPILLNGNVGTSGYVLTSAGVGNTPTWTQNNFSLITGTLTVDRGGTGLTNVPVGQILFGTGSTVLASSSNLYWNNTSALLGIGITPTVSLDISTTVGSSSYTQRMIAYGLNGSIGSIITMWGARGSSVSPSAVLSNDLIAGLSFRTYGTSAFATSSTGSVFAYASENHTNTARGTDIRLGTTAVGSANRRDTLISYGDGKMGLPITSPPAASNSTGITGQISWDASYIYVCTATNTWKRAGIATW